MNVLSRENDAMSRAMSPEKRFSPEKGSPSKHMSPFKKGGKATSSRTGRSALTDKTNQSPAKAFQTPFRGQATSFVTPADNIGRAGQIKARLGEMYDAQRDTVPDTSEPTDMEPVEEEWPEIEYMPSRTPTIPYDMPPILDGWPRAKEVAALLAGAPLLRQEPGSAIETRVKASDLALEAPHTGGRRAAGAPRPTPPVRSDALSRQVEKALHQPFPSKGFVVTE
ncbi:uncharacterized protein MRET_3353 [Malassezia restricta]|uniref:uncharacterized protein n=1 Tax=Malassezia restricta TaxID=76775 RepID=UPI000DD1262A|nr:uncharacterized protein MRET_3353 [Malassezia restricta]AXA50886.1 uncharacterized protein MRET_3353 [Malassezia restricta]